MMRSVSPRMRGSAFRGPRLALPGTASGSTVTLGSSASQRSPRCPHRGARSLREAKERAESTGNLGPPAAQSTRAWIRSGRPQRAAGRWPGAAVPSTKRANEMRTCHVGASTTLRACLPERAKRCGHASLERAPGCGRASPSERSEADRPRWSERSDAGEVRPPRASGTLAEAAETPNPPAELREGLVELLAPEVGPAYRCRIVLRVGGLPKQEIAQPHLATRANHQVQIEIGRAS